jgi:elongation factor 1 alpha-like protein
MFIGKLPTPINEVDTDALVSKTGVRVELGTKSKNNIPEKFTDDAMNAMDKASTITKKLKPTTAHLSAVRDASPMRNGKVGSAPSSPSLKRSEPPIKIFKPEVIEAEYQELRKDSKPSINLVVIGHVDAGKSTLMGRLLCDLGYVSQKVMHRNETDSKKAGKSSFAYAWVLDETDEERTRGITMDVASSRFETTNRKVTILDAPGHKDFIPNMITGAAQADVALLVVDSTVGEFESGFEAGGQTREHTMLVRSLGVSQLAVVVNKLDNVKWDQKRYKEIKEKLSHFLKQTGFKDSDVTFVPCSGLTGENLCKKSEQPLLAWYSGPCLVDVIDKFKSPERPISKPCRITIADIFKGQVAGVCISARIDAGFVTTGQKMMILPSAEPCSVKSISLNDESTEKAFAGDNVVIILLGCDVNNFNIGSVICDPSFPVPVSSKFEAKIVVFNSVHIPITKGFPVVIHFGSSSEQAVVKKLVSQINRSTGEVMKNRPRCLFKNSSGVVVIEVSRPICLEKYKDNKDLGRFMLRSSGNTIAAGLIDQIM